MSDEKTMQAHNAIEWIKIAQEAIDDAISAQRDDYRFAFLSAANRRLNNAIKALKAFTPITEALPTEPPATRDPDSGRPSLVEPAALSDINHNFGG